MIEWFLRTHSWNRIALCGAMVAPVAKAVFSTLTAAHMIGLPTGAAVLWACGWAAIGTWDIARRRWEQLVLLDTSDVPLGSEA
jgi:hypothetical protein